MVSVTTIFTKSICNSAGFVVVERKFTMAEPIPEDVRAILKAEPFMERCCCTGKSNPQWHHNFEYARKAVNEAWCILPLAPEVHLRVRERKLRQLLDWCMLNRGKKGDLRRFSRVNDYIYRLDQLNALYGEFSQRKLRQFYETKEYEVIPLLPV